MTLQHLNSLLENYLEPLKKETFLSTAEINALFGNIQEIVAFQRLFLHSLEEAMALEPNFQVFDQPFQFKVLTRAFAPLNAAIFKLSTLTFVRMFCSPWATLSFTMPTISNCTARSVPVIPKLKRFYCPVSRP